MPQKAVGSNYLSIPELPAPGTKVVIYTCSMSFLHIPMLTWLIPVGHDYWIESCQWSWVASHYKVLLPCLCDKTKQKAWRCLVTSIIQLVYGHATIVKLVNFLNSSWPHAFARIMARERRLAHGPNSRDCWSPGEPARVQPPFPQDIWTLSCSVIRLALIGTGVLARIWSISNN